MEPFPRSARIAGAALLVLGMTATAAWADDYSLSRPGAGRSGTIILEDSQTRTGNQDQLRRNADKAQSYANKNGEAMGGIVILDESGLDPDEAGLSEAERQLRRSADKAQNYSRGDAAQGDVLILPADAPADALNRLQINNAKAQIYSQGKKPCATTGVLIGGIGEGGDVTAQSATVIQGVNSYSPNCK